MIPFGLPAAIPDVAVFAHIIRWFSVPLHYPMFVGVELFVMVASRRLGLKSLFAIVAPKAFKNQAKVLLRLLLFLHLNFKTIKNSIKNELSGHQFQHALT